MSPDQQSLKNHRITSHPTQWATVNSNKLLQNLQQEAASLTHSWFMDPPESTPQMHMDPFSHFCGVHGNVHRDHGTSVTRLHLMLCIAMWPKNQVTINSNASTSMRTKKPDRSWLCWMQVDCSHNWQLVQRSKVLIKTFNECMQQISILSLYTHTSI